MSPPFPSEHARSDPRQFLLSRINYERQTAIPYRSRCFKLDRMLRLLEALGGPQQQLPAVHIAGTKGKGSTAALISRCLQVAGHRTGLYTSPHLRDVTERLQVDGQPCTEEQLQLLVERIRPIVEAMDGQEEYAVTYFEIVTALAFMHFVERQVDLAVLEVGLGGRLDSTNVCHPAVSVITTISLDHTEQLGNSLAEIAAEKAGIIKPQVPVVCGWQEESAWEVIEAKARRRSAACRRLGRDFDFTYHAAQQTGGFATMDYHRLEHSGREGRLGELEVGLRGRHQASNAAVALATLDELHRQGWPCPESTRREGLRSANCPARIEVVHTDPTVVIDAAHNEASIRALIDTLNETGWGRAGQRILIFATSRDKDAPAMLGLLLPHFDKVFITQYAQNLRVATVEDLYRAARENHALQPHALQPHALQPGSVTPVIRTTENAVDAWLEARRIAQPPDLICVTGSFFLAAELRPHALRDEGRWSRPAVADFSS